MTDYSISVPRGDDQVISWTITDNDGDPVDITTASLVFSVKKNFNDTEYSFQRKNTVFGGGDAEIEITTGVSGCCDLKIVPANTSGLDVGTYQYDFKGVIDGATGTIRKDNFIIENDVFE